MTITLTTTAGSASANSYCDLADAEAYVATLNWYESWTGKTDEQKKGALVQATRLFQSLAWKGRKASNTQALVWPRAYVTDRDGYAVDSTTIPVWLEEATAEFALRLLAEDRQADLGANVPGQAKVGSLFITGNTHQMLPSAVYDLIGPYLESGGGGNLVVRS